MTDQPLTKIANQSPGALLDRFEPSDEARALLADGMGAEQYLRALIAEERHADAAQFLAHALPKREAVWWACVAVNAAGSGELTPQAQKALHFAGLWVRDPTDEHRVAAKQAATEAGVETAAGMTALAAYLSTLKTPPPGTGTGSLAGSAVVMAAVTPDPLAAAGKYATLLAQGLNIAAGLAAGN